MTHFRLIFTLRLTIRITAADALAVTVGALLALALALLTTNDGAGKQGSVANTKENTADAPTGSDAVVQVNVVGDDDDGVETAHVNGAAAGEVTLSFTSVALVGSVSIRVTP